eukprot:5862959-Pyramimonas_sp.AAC.1
MQKLVAKGKRVIRVRLDVEVDLVRLEAEQGTGLANRRLRMAFRSGCTDGYYTRWGLLQSCIAGLTVILTN